MITEKWKSEIRRLKPETTQNSKLRTQNCKAFTLVEILTVVFIIAILVGVLVPAFNMVRKTARDVQQKAQLASIEIGLNLYKNDFGDYPTSHGFTSRTAQNPNYVYCGAQTLVEAMFGQDLLGVDPNTSYTLGTGTPPYADEYIYGNAAYDVNDRKGPYLDRTHINVLTPRNLFGDVSAVEPDMFVICDVYTKAKKYVQLPNGVSKKMPLSMPVLYYKANISRTNNNSSTTSDNIYDSQDNENLLGLGALVVEKAKTHPLADRTAFYKFIKDPMTSTTTPNINRPVRPDSFLLISAGNDGLYGTADDICNFEPNIE